MPLRLKGEGYALHEQSLSLDAKARLVRLLRLRLLVCPKNEAD